MAWPARQTLWGARLELARREYACCANAIAAFEPVTMVCADQIAAASARAALASAVDVIVMPLDDSWLRDSGPIFLLDGSGSRAGVHFRFNAWGEKYETWARDEAAGRALADRYSPVRYDAPLVLEGGSVITDGSGTLLTTEQCLQSPSRNPGLGRAQLEKGLRDFLGVERTVWLRKGLADDVFTDVHVDFVAAFTAPGELLLQSAPPDSEDFPAMEENCSRVEAAGLRVTEMPLLPEVDLGGEEFAASYLNFYLCNGAVVVPAVNASTDEEAVELIQAAFPDREAVPVPGEVLAWGGGGPHCITQPVPRRPGRATS